MKRILGLILAGLLFYAGCGNVENLETQNFTPPSVKNQPKVFYPLQAQENSLTGVTEVMLYVDSEGRVKQTEVSESSGYDVLDSTAEQYCRGIIFNPALAGKKPIGSWVKWKVKFDVSHENFFAKRFVNDMIDLYSEVSSSSASERKGIQEEILNEDNEFVKKMTDVLNFNRTIEEVLLPRTVAEWKKYWDTYPLSFLLYYDFIRRYPDYPDLPAIKTQMLSELKNDINFVKSMSALKSDKKGTKGMLLLKLQKFAKDNSPNLSQMSSILAVR